MKYPRYDETINVKSDINYKNQNNLQISSYNPFFSHFVLKWVSNNKAHVFGRTDNKEMLFSVLRQLTYLDLNSVFSF